MLESNSDSRLRRMRIHVLTFVLLKNLSKAALICSVPLSSVMGENYGSILQPTHRLYVNSEDDQGYCPRTMLCC